MSTAAVTQEPELDVVQHPVLGPLKFPKDMGPDERNESIDRAMAARPNTGLAPAAGGPNSPTNPIRQDIERNKYSATAGLPGGLPAPANDTMTELGALGIGAGAAAVYGPAALQAAKPFILPAAGSYAISKARDLPVVGPILKHIPFAEMIPWMASGRGKGGAEAESEIPEPDVYRSGYRAPRAYYGGEAPAPVPSRPGLQLEGETAQPVEGEYVAPRPSATRTQPPFAPATAVAPRSPEPLPAPYRRGPGEVAAEDVSSPDSSVLAGRQGVIVRPQNNRGLALPSAPPVEAPGRAPVRPVDTAKLGDLLNEGTGGKLPDDYTPVNGSSVIRGYKYDPTTKEFEAATTGGTYIHGDVSPEQTEAFESAKSKGKAWTELKDNSTYVGKIVNGKRVAAKPPRDLGSASPDDLTPLLQKSLDAARKARTARIAKPN
jgi:hypothetical protein